MATEVVEAPVAIQPVETAKAHRDWPARALFAAALVYALLAGLRTVTDFDLGWQLATGRWIVQHHQMPSTDVFSYTASGQPWIYPVGSGLLFYGLYKIGGYLLLSWCGALACLTTIWLLVRGTKAATSALVIFAMPVIAARSVARADLFSLLLFVAFLSLLAEHLRTARARLWLLPVLMVAWSNLHLGFITGLVLIASYVALEIENLLLGRDPKIARERLRMAMPWLVATIPATLVNPWGWNLYLALIRQNRAMAQHAQWISEWASSPLTWLAIRSPLSLQNGRGVFFLLLALAMVIAVALLVSRRLVMAVIIFGASYMALRHHRFETLFCCLLVVIAGSAISSAWEKVESRWTDARMRQILRVGAIAAMAILCLERSYQIVTNRYYLGATEAAEFGTGLGWWCPERAASFIEREHLPGQIFNNYNTGGFLIWRLGQDYKDYLDGRAIPFGPEVFSRQAHLMESDPDGPLWRREADALGINTILLSLARYDGDVAGLPKFCASRQWRPVYLDEVSAVLVRSKPQNELLISKFAVDCATFAFPPPPAGLSSSRAFQYWANSMTVLSVLGRNREAWAASNRAMAIFPENAHLRFLRGMILRGMGNTKQAEMEYRVALDLEPNDLIWDSLASLMREQGRNDEADQAMQNAMEMSARPHQRLINLAFSQVLRREPQDALRSIAEALRRAPPEAAENRQFQTEVLRARAAALNLMGQPAEAIALQKKTLELMPESPDLWLELGDLYELNGYAEEAVKARNTAQLLEHSGTIH